MATKQHKITISKYYDKNIATPVMTISVSQGLVDLLANFAIVHTKKNTRWLMIPLDAELNQISTPALYYQRYAVKTVLMSSVNDNTGWQDFFDLLFTPQIFADKSITVPLSSNQGFVDIERRVEQTRYLLKAAESLLTERKINATFDIEVTA